MTDYVTVVICVNVIPRVVLPALIATVVVIGAGLADVVLSIVDGNEILRPFATVTATIPSHFVQAIRTKGLFLAVNHNGKQFLISAATVHAVSQLVGVSIHTFHPPKFWGSSRHPTTTYPEGYVVSSFYLEKRTHQVVSEDTNIADPVSILLYVIADFPHSHRELWSASAEDTQVSFLVRDNHSVVKVHTVRQTPCRLTAKRLSGAGHGPHCGARLTAPTSTQIESIGFYGVFEKNFQRKFFSNTPNG